MYQCEAWYVRHGVCQMSQMEIHCCDWIGFDMTDIVCVRWTCTTMPLVQRVSNWTSCTGRHNGLIRDSRTGDPPSLTDWLLRTDTSSRPITWVTSLTPSLYSTHSDTDTVSVPLYQTQSATCHKLTITHSSHLTTQTSRRSQTVFSLFLRPPTSPLIDVCVCRRWLARSRVMAMRIALCFDWTTAVVSRGTSLMRFAWHISRWMGKG